MPNWETFQVARPGEQADNEALPELEPRRQVWITRGTYTRVILVADDAGESTPVISTQRWA